MSINLITPWSQILSIIYFLSVVNTQFSGLDKNIDGLERKVFFEISNSGLPFRIHSIGHFLILDSK